MLAVADPIIFCLHMLTRMNSSRMRTARLLAISPSMHCSRGGEYAPGRGVPAPGRGVLLGGVSQHALRQTPQGMLGY